MTSTRPGLIAGAASARAECARTTCSFVMAIESCSDRRAARSVSESQPWLVTKTKGAPESRTFFFFFFFEFGKMESEEREGLCLLFPG